MLDERTFDASQSKQLALLRATLALAIAARIGEGSVATEDADVFARQLAEASNELNYAAADAGYPVFNADGETTTATCSIAKGLNRDDVPGGKPDAIAKARLQGADYLEADAACAGYYVNFEANIARIESRIVRAMLTSLPTDRARKFLEQLTQGNLLSALWSLARATGDLSGAFHRGAGVYRAGLENVAASTKNCAFDEDFRRRFDHEEFNQRRDTVLIAAGCLGLSPDDLFDDAGIGAEDLPNLVDPRAFLALFRISRTSCVALPLLNAPATAEGDEYLNQARKNRKESCDLVRFNPKKRADEIMLPGDPQPPAVAPPAPAEPAAPAAPVAPPAPPAPVVAPSSEPEQLPAMPPPP